MAGVGGGACEVVVGGMCGRGVCVAGGACMVVGEHAWQGVCGGYAWRGACVAGGMHTTQAPPRHHEIQSVNARAVRILLECILVLNITTNRKRYF